MSIEKNTLEDLVNVATQTLERLGSIHRPNLDVDDLRALLKMQSQIELAVTDLAALHTDPDANAEEIERIGGLILTFAQTVEAIS
ncbi:hypothetical protein IFT48_02750 [Pseudomonas fluorescens]|uniref:hypothetical protein n=1 Tax=Pseudomonas fluorescens TaxID=294 RepID=UPI0019309649|nr:hypothetical protein [Pseudomonas fluorescens]MBD8088885.1 hypothetical protein [Pseudomonas fluorescens]